MGLTQEEFISAFRALQQFLYAIYENIERTSPFEWGWQSNANDESFYGADQNRIMNMLIALAKNSEFVDDELKVSKRKFLPGKNNFSDIGLIFEGLKDKKSDIYTISYPDTPNMLRVFKSYFKERRRVCCKCHKVDNYPCMDNCPQTYISYHQLFGTFSYRFIEQFPANIDDSEIFFLAFTDSMPKDLQEIFYYLHNETTEYGFRIKPWTTCHNGVLRYWNYMENWRRMSFLPIGSGTYWGDAFSSLQSGQWEIRPLFDTPPIFKRIFKTHPEEANELVARFPKVFLNAKCNNCNKNDCKNRIDKQENIFCAKMIRFENPDLDDVKFILKLYKIEHNIKKL